MHTHAEKQPHTDTSNTGKGTFLFDDRRPESAALNRLQALADASPGTSQLCAFQAKADGGLRTAAVARFGAMQAAPIQYQAADDEETLQGKLAPLQPTTDEQPADAGRHPNNTGLPDNLKSGIETLSGIGMDNVRVHYNSDKPAQLNAYAYAQGTDIHIAPGQERHLPHEAWHVVQQVRGQVNPTMQMKGGVPVNDDAGLEREADLMGEKALQPNPRTGASHPVGMTARPSALQLMQNSDIPQLETLVTKIEEDYEGYTVVSMGGSGVPIAAYINARESTSVKAVNIPLSIKSFYPTRLEKEQENQFSEMLSGCGLNLAEGKFVFVDVSASGGSLAAAVTESRRIYKNSNIVGLGMVDTVPSIDSPTVLDKLSIEDPETFRIVSPATFKNSNMAGFLGKLMLGDGKQYRPVGVFKPHKNDVFSVYEIYEDTIMKMEEDAGVFYTARMQYEQLVEYLKKGNEDSESPVPSIPGYMSSKKSSGAANNQSSNSLGLDAPITNDSENTDDHEGHKIKEDNLAHFRLEYITFLRRNGSGFSNREEIMEEAKSHILRTLNGDKPSSSEYATISGRKGMASANGADAERDGSKDCCSLQ